MSLASYLVVFLLLLLAEVLYLRLAQSFGLYDVPKARSSHSTPVLRGGGIVFYLAVLVWYIINGFDDLPFFVGLTLISAVGLADDMRGAGKLLRIVIYTVSVYLLTLSNISLTMPLLMYLLVGVSFINVYNFMDGINGMTAFYSLQTLLVLWLLNSTIGFVNQSFIVVVALSVLVFAIFNVRKQAKCFAGDLGAYSMSFIMLYLSSLLIEKTGDWTYAALFAVYATDTALTLLHRIAKGENIFQAHRQHIYQILANEGHMPQLVVSAIYSGVQLAISLTLIYAPVERPVYVICVLAALVVAFTLLRFYRRQRFKN